MSIYDFGGMDPHQLGMARSGEAVRFLGRNGHDIELADALEQFKVGQELVVEECSIGSWVSYYTFTDDSGCHHNTVMFEPVAQGTEAGTAETSSGSVHDGPVPEGNAP